MGEDFAIDARFANATSDELSVLRSKVKYDDGFVLYFWYQKSRPRDSFKASKGKREIMNVGLYDSK